MKYGFMIMMFCIVLPACCLRKERKKMQPEESMIIEEEMTMPMMQDEQMGTMPDTGMDVLDMATMQDEMTVGK